MPSIIDPAAQVGGAWTVTRSILGLLRDGPLQAQVEVVAVQRRSLAAHRLRQSVAMARSLVSRLPSKIEFARSRGFASKVRALCRQPFDLFVLNGTDLLWLLPDLPAATRTVLIALNIEHQLFASQIGGFRGGGFAGSLLRRDLNKLRDFEIEGLRRVRNVVFLSTSDAEYARMLCPEVRSMVVPPLFENPAVPRPARIRTAESFHLGMLANFEWWPNREGLAWFLERVFPHVSSRIQLHVFGNRSESAAPRHPRIRRYGYIANLSQVWNTCDVIIAPIISGGGVCVKVAEAIYHGMPILGSRFSARGLPLDPDPSIVLLDRPEEWIGLLNTAADALAAQTVPRSIADRFRAEAYGPALAEFMIHTLASPGKGA